ncbi:MAG: hypothetical protein LBC95_00805 [Candidatus Nomurabacteria bacterium]|jgi:hypothetical protein|nr:hypothetical protein [Candidatus Nomurabacteria bacterium]
MNGWKDRWFWLWRRLRKVKFWQLVLVFVGLVVVMTLCLRSNSQGMIELRQQLVAADRDGSAAEIERAAVDLRRYVAGHMNADTGLIPLQNSYNRAVEAAFQAANNQINSGGYVAATESCQSQIATGGYQGYAACVAGAVGLSSDDFATPNLPNPALYYISYASPLISFDLAGTVTVLVAVVFFAIILRALSEVIPIIILRYRRKNT